MEFIEAGLVIAGLIGAIVMAVREIATDGYRRVRTKSRI